MKSIRNYPELIAKYNLPITATYKHFAGQRMTELEWDEALKEFDNPRRLSIRSFPDLLTEASGSKSQLIKKFKGQRHTESEWRELVINSNPIRQATFALRQELAEDLEMKYDLLHEKLTKKLAADKIALDVKYEQSIKDMEAEYKEALDASTLLACFECNRCGEILPPDKKVSGRTRCKPCHSAAQKRPKKQE